MKIAFVTSSLDPGRDGVGDYTTLLAEECARRGQAVTRLAVNDVAADEKPDLLRLARARPWPERVSAARAWLETFAPDWISFQFVCYGYDPRGLVGQVAPSLQAILAGWPIDIFFHELWIGQEIGSPLKTRAIGFLQRRGVEGLCRRLPLRRIFTSNEAYVELLRRRGFPAVRLPLFGSLPLPESASPPTPADGPLRLAMFGTLHPVWPAEPLFTYLCRTGRPIHLSHAGKIGTGETLWNRLAEQYSGRIAFERLGELPSTQIASIFQQAHFGVATTPWVLIGKSASVAAMLDLGLPVIVNRDEVQYPGYQPPPGDPLLIRMSEDLPEQLASARRQPARLRLGEVCDRFLELER